MAGWKFLQEQLNLSTAKLKSSEHARRTAESKIAEQSNMLEVSFCAAGCLPYL